MYLDLSLMNDEIISEIGLMYGKTMNFLSW